MGNVIKFKRNIQKLYDRANDKCDDGDYVSALSSLLNEAENYLDNAEVCAHIADIYTELGLYENAIIFWFKYMKRAKKKDYFDGYNGLGANYYFSGDTRVAGYYFNEQLSVDPTNSGAYGDALEEFLDEAFKEERKFHLVKDKTQDEIDGEIIENAKALNKDGEYQKAIEVLNQITEDRKSFAEALSERAFSHYCLDEIERAVYYAEKSIELGFTSIGSLTFIIHLLLSADKPNAEYYLELLINFEVEDTESKYKKLNALCEFYLFEDAEKLCDELLNEEFYDVNTSFIKAFLTYNRGDYKGAEQNFRKAYLLSFNPVALYYLRLSQSAIEGKATVGELRVSFDLPYEVIEDYFNIIKKIANDHSLIKNYSKRLLTDIADWCFTLGPQQAQSVLTVCFARSDDNYYINYLKEVLINPTVRDDVKKHCVAVLYENGVKKGLKVVFSHYFKEIKTQMVEFKEVNKTVFKKAYCYAIACLSVYEKKRLATLEIGALELQNELISSGMADNEFSVQALACAMYFYSGEKLVPKELVYHLFKTEKERVVEILKMTEINND